MRIRDLKADRALTALLCKAAGVDGKHVRAITCRCEAGKFVEFDIKLLSDEATIEEALGSVAEQQ